MATILLLHGPNLNLLGKREPDQYGTSTLDVLNSQLTQKAKKQGHTLTNFQTNAEHELIDRIHQAKEQGIDIIIINPAAWTHTSVALRDALLAVKIVFIEVHLTNIYTRELFRQHSYFSDIALGVIAGFGIQSYEFALEAAMIYLNNNG